MEKVKFSKKSLHSIIVSSPSHMEHSFYKLFWVGLSLIFDDILNPLPITLKAIGENLGDKLKSHLVKAQEKTKRDTLHD